LINGGKTKNHVFVQSVMALLCAVAPPTAAEKASIKAQIKKDYGEVLDLHHGFCCVRVNYNGWW
jgi:hypothetical protein